jgi:hypothetical protein
LRSWFPLADYDFWGYLAAGGVLTFALAAFAGIPASSLDFRDPVTIGAIIAIAYTLGHANASLSSWLIESWLVGMFIGPPVAVMIGAKRPGWLARILAPSYRTLPEFTLQALRTRLGTDMLPTPEEMFQRAYHFARRFADVRERLDQFRNQYGFGRNATLAVAIAGGAAMPWVIEYNFLWLLLVMTTALLLLTRYLKFYRLFAVEVLHTFAFRGPE